MFSQLAKVLRSGITESCILTYSFLQCPAAENCGAAGLPKPVRARQREFQLESADNPGEKAPHDQMVEIDNRPHASRVHGPQKWISTQRNSYRE